MLNIQKKCPPPLSQPVYPQLSSPQARSKETGGATLLFPLAVLSNVSQKDTLHRVDAALIRSFGEKQMELNVQEHVGGWGCCVRQHRERS